MTARPPAVDEYKIQQFELHGLCNRGAGHRTDVIPIHDLRVIFHLLSFVVARQIRVAACITAHLIFTDIAPTIFAAVSYLSNPSTVVEEALHEPSNHSYQKSLIPTQGLQLSQ